MILIEQLSDSNLDEEEKAWLIERVKEAEDFLLSQPWCEGIVRGWYERSYSTLLALFFFEILPLRSYADTWTWVIVGDLPPAYIDIQSCPTANLAIDGYLGAAQEWVDALRNSQSTEDIIPVLVRNSLRTVPETLEYADELERRLLFIEQNLRQDILVAENNELD